MREYCNFFISIINVLVKDTGLIEDDILRNAATSVRSIIKPWSDYVCRHEYGRVRVCEKPTTLSSSVGKLSSPILKWYEHVALCNKNYAGASCQYVVQLQSGTATYQSLNCNRSLDPGLF